MFSETCPNQLLVDKVHKTYYGFFKLHVFSATSDRSTVEVALYWRFFFDLVKIQSEGGGGCHLHFKHSIAPKVRHLASGRVDSN